MIAAGVIYVIRSAATGRVYVGSTVRAPRQRWLEHLHYLRKGTHHTPHLQRVFNKYCESDLSFEVIESVLRDADVLKAEQDHIDSSMAPLMNSAPVSESIHAAHAANRGRVMPDSERQRRSVSAKMAIAEGRALRKPWDEDRKARHSIALTGRKMPPISDQTRQKISDGHRLRHALLGTSAEPARDRYAFIAAERESWLVMWRAGKSFREIEALTGRARKVIARECKRGEA